MKKGKAQISKQARRKFLQGSAVTGAGALLATAIPKVVTAAATDEHKESMKQNKKEEGYRLTEHIREYYKTAAS